MDLNLNNINLVANTTKYFSQVTDRTNMDNVYTYLLHAAVSDKMGERQIDCGNVIGQEVK